jgi:hypothetical protein
VTFFLSLLRRKNATLLDAAATESLEVLFLAAATEKGRKTTARLQPHRAVVKSMNRAAELVLKKTLL